MTLATQTHPGSSTHHSALPTLTLIHVGVNPGVMSRRRYGVVDGRVQQNDVSVRPSSDTALARIDVEYLCCCCAGDAHIVAGRDET